MDQGTMVSRGEVLFVHFGIWNCFSRLGTKHFEVLKIEGIKRKTSSALLLFHLCPIVLSICTLLQ